MSNIIYELNNVSRAWPSGGGMVLALNDVSLSISTGTLYSVVGPSGSGKSTLLNLLGTLERPSAGQVNGFGQPLHKMSEAALINLRREKIGFVFQSFNLLSRLTALENVMLPLELAGKKNRVARANECLELAGFPLDRKTHRPTRLSGGECQRVSIARALANDPHVILADEPTGNLDSNTSQQITDLLTNLVRKQGRTVIIVTHDKGVAGITDQVIRLKDGRIA